MTQRSQQRWNTGKRGKVAIRNAVRVGIELKNRAITYGSDPLGIGGDYPQLSSLQKKVLENPKASKISQKSSWDSYKSQLEKALKGEKQICHPA